MKLSDEKVIEFLSKSPVKVFATMADVLRYLEGKFIQADAEWEVMNDAIGDNWEGQAKIRIPNFRGVTTIPLRDFLRHSIAFNLIRRRTSTAQPFPNPPGRRIIYEEPPELIVRYELTPSGSYMLKVLEVLTDVSEFKMPAVGGA
jgi:hypothetical protein